MLNTWRLFLITGLAAFGLGLPQTCFAASCSNPYLAGTYNGQIGNVELLTTLGAGATIPSVFGSTTNSLTQVAGEARYYFDGNGTIAGAAAASSGGGIVAVGTYTVNSDCTLSMKFTGGPTYDGVLANNGATVLFLESDTTGHGATGMLVRSPNSCAGFVPSLSGSYGFSYYGASTGGTGTTGTGTTGTGTTGTGTTGTGTTGTGTTGTGTTGTGTTGTGTTGTGTTGTGTTGTGTTGTGTTGTGTTGTGTTGTGTTGTGTTGTGTTGTGTTGTAATGIQPFSAVGTLTLAGQGTFTMTEWVYAGGAITTQSAMGSYTVGTDCTMKFTYTANPTSTGSSPTIPMPTFFGALGANGQGLLTVQSSGYTGEVINVQSVVGQ